MSIESVADSVNDGYNVQWHLLIDRWVWANSTSTWSDNATSSNSTDAANASATSTDAANATSRSTNAKRLGNCTDDLAKIIKNLLGLFINLSSRNDLAILINRLPSEVKLDLGKLRIQASASKSSRSHRIYLQRVLAS